ncbi:hypothetical protein [Dyella acidiphila]|uniref:Uncharacterized protein n=1 Tax=Dyella acidiphila TaxID=2775866 RepID=A0ABR9G4X0_9GAMM|nr:hypothetical protein [Dyella acidiphila]MBE1159058.1 hypothetical protein [Dyella acidiphila]
MQTRDPFEFPAGEGIALAMAVLEDVLKAYQNFERKHPHMERSKLMAFDARELKLLHASLEALSHYADKQAG